MDNSIDIDHLRRIDLSVQDIRDIITVLETATAHLLVPDEVVAALDRLRKATK
jgi:hypothetical protein